MVFSGRERGETSRTGPINLEMIGRMKLELMMIGMWKIWRTARNRLWQLRSLASPLQFRGEYGILTCIYDQVREKEHVLSVLGSQQDVLTGRKKKRKQVENTPACT